ncbi:MAG: ABC transporter substrate-binding protein [Acidobacteriota bacterium]|nr:ABC transporter substrate-binding protein [Acidobacteriota bacterium]
MPRIVSLIASATEIVDALGMTAHLVGRSHECDYPEAVRALPVCTQPRIPPDAASGEIDRLVKESARNAISIYDVFADVIERLEPTHILTQIQCEVCAVSLRDVEAAFARGMKGQPRVVSLQPDSLEGIRADIRRVAEALGRSGAGETLLADLAAAMPEVRCEHGVSVACIEWMDPLMAAGNWMPELIALAGGVNLFGEAGRHSPWMTWEQLRAADPDVIVVAPCGFGLERTERELDLLTARAEWRALRGRKYIADGNRYFNRPGPQIAGTYRVLCEILHPERFAPSMRGSAWRALS